VWIFSSAWKWECTLEWQPDDKEYATMLKSMHIVWKHGQMSWNGKLGRLTKGSGGISLAAMDMIRYNLHI
jgi:hypothetical protein